MNTRFICIVILGLGASSVASARTNEQHVTFKYNSHSFTDSGRSDFGDPHRSVDAATRQWIWQAGAITQLDDVGDTSQAGCNYLSGDNVVFGVTGCTDGQFCANLGEWFPCGNGHWTMELDQIDLGKWSLTPNSNTKHWAFAVLLHEFGHAYGLDDDPTPPIDHECVMDASGSPAEDTMDAYFCGSDINSLVSAQGNAVLSGDTFRLAVSRSAGFPDYWGGGGVFTNTPSWTQFFADFSSPASVSGNSNYQAMLTGHNSFDWPTWPSTGHLSAFTTDSMRARPTVVIATKTNTIWAFWRHDVADNDNRIEYATSTDNITWINRGFVKDASGNFAHSRMPVSVYYDQVRRKIVLAYTVWSTIVVPTCPATEGCANDIAITEISDTNAGGSWAGLNRAFQSAVGPPTIACTSYLAYPYTECQMVWVAADANRSIAQNWFKFNDNGTYWSSGASVVGGQSTDFPLGLDLFWDGNGAGTVIAITGTDKALHLSSKLCVPECGAFSSWYIVAESYSQQATGPVLKVDPINRFYRVYSGE